MVEVITKPAQATQTRTVTIRRNALSSAKLVPEVSEEWHVVDQYRRIIRPIIERQNALNTAQDIAARLCLVTSALSGDGKTFASMNLALSIARDRSYTVLLVDGDVAKRHLSHLLGVEKEMGLMDALGNEAVDVESLVLPTNIPGLNILSAGRGRVGATELLLGAHMEEVMGCLSQWDRDRIVIIDSPPLLLSAESRALTHVVGQIVLVVRAGVTPQSAVTEAMSQFSHGKLTGVLFNQKLALTDTYGRYGTYGDQGAPVDNSK